MFAIFQVWKEPKIWDGFIKCCERCYPQSYKVLLQLPPTQLEFFFSTRPQMRETLLVHVQNFTDAQRAHIPPQTTKVLYNQYIVAPEVKTEPAEGSEDAAGNAEAAVVAVGEEDVAPPGE